MNDLIVWRDKLQELYATKSIYIDKAVQFVLALVTFLMINQNIGLMKAVATPGSDLHLPSTSSNGICSGRTCDSAYVQAVYGSGSGSGTDLCGNVYFLLQIYTKEGTSSTDHTGGVHASYSICRAGCLCTCTWTDLGSTGCVRNDHLLHDRMCKNFGNSDHQRRWDYQADFTFCEDSLPG